MPFDPLSHGNKNLNQVGKYAVVTFARNVISTRQLILKRLLDIAGALVGMVILGIATILLHRLLNWNLRGPYFLDRPALERMDAVLRFISSVLCIRMQNSERRN